MRYPIGKTLHARRWLVAALVVAGVGLRLRTPAPPEATQAGVASMLGAAVEGEVAEGEFLWEPSRGSLLDALWGRQVLFTGRSEGPRDLYRARVRVSREGRPIEVVQVRNLTETPLGDEGELTARGRQVAYVTRAFDAVQGITVLGLDGPALDALSRSERWRVRADQWLETGTTAGLDRREVVFYQPPPSARFELRDDQLVLALGGDDAPASLTFATMAVNPGPEDPFVTRAWSTPPRRKPWLHFGMDALRSMFGTDAADRFKSVLFAFRSSWLQEGETRPPVDPPSIEPPSEAEPANSWPPAPIAPRFEHPLENEGQWHPPGVDFLPQFEGGVGDVPPAMLHTVVRPNPELPFASVRLVAIDTRQLELRIEAGFDEPRPATGPRGRGRIPEEARPDLVAAFNGAFQTRHGSYGMAVDGRVLLPPKAGAATVAVDVFGETRIGSWTAAATDDDPLPPEIHSLRQNLDPLIEGGVINPRGRTQWGFPLEGLSYLTERSALCRTRQGHLIYGWGMEVTAQTLAEGMKAAGCDYAMHLDMNPGHVGFVFHGGADASKAELLTHDMSIAPRRFLEASPKDFFYLVRRHPAPRYGEVSWKPAADIAHPPPAWLPAVYRAETEQLGRKVDLLAIDPTRFRWELSPGKEERAGRTAEGALSKTAQARALMAIGLGVGLKRGNRRGLAIDGVIALPLRPDLGLLLVRKDGSLQVARTVANLVPDEDASEVRIMAENGVVRPEARKLRERRARTAACMIRPDAAFVAIAESDNVEAPTRALLDLGCQRVVELDRGNQSAGFVHFAGTAEPPAADYDDTVLYALARAMGGRVRPIVDAGSSASERP